MRLLVISHTPHYRRGGRAVGWAATVHELSRIAGIVDELVHAAPVWPGEGSGADAGYEAENVRLVGLAPSGGEGLTAKAGIGAAWLSTLPVLLRELRKADAVHVRLPCNVGLLALLVLCVKREPRRRWLKYAGNWGSYPGEPWSYRLQKWILKKGWVGGVVTVNGEWEDAPPHVRAFYNPSFSAAELEEARRAGRAKRMDGVLRCAYVGRVEEAKGAGRAVEIVQRLRERGVEAELDVVGEGPLRGELEKQGEPWVRFHGWLPRKEVSRVWREAHVCLLPSRTEGWPKVLSEGMAWGVVPVASDVGCVRQYLRRFGCGAALDARDLEGFVETLRGYAAEPERWKSESERAMEAAGEFTYEAHVRRVAEVLGVK